MPPEKLTGLRVVNTWSRIAGSAGTVTAWQAAARSASVCLDWVNLVVLTLGQPLPVYPSERTSRAPIGMSQRCQKQKFTPNSPYSLLHAIRPRGRSRQLAVLAQPVQGLMLTEAAQFEMADFNDRCRNFGGKSTSHEQWPANILAEEFQPAEDVDVAPDGGEAWSAASVVCAAARADSQAGAGSSPVTGKIAMTASPIYFRMSPSLPMTPGTTRSKKAFRSSMILCSGSSSVSRLKPRKSASSIAALMWRTFPRWTAPRHNPRARISTYIGGKKFTIDPPARRHFENWGKGRH